MGEYLLWFFFQRALAIWPSVGEIVTKLDRFVS